MIKYLMAGMLLVGLSWAVPVDAAEPHEHHEHHEMEAGTALPGASLYNLTSEWTTQEGRRGRLGWLQGRPVVAAMVYTSCKEMCPMTIEQIRQVQDEVTRRSLGPVHYVLWSFDSEKDTPQHLKDFAEARGLDPHDWTLMHGDPAAIRELAAVLGISYRRDAKGDFDHSYAITLLDGQGIVAYQQTGLRSNPDEFISRIAAMTTGAR